MRRIRPLCGRGTVLVAQATNLVARLRIMPTSDQPGPRQGRLGQEAGGMGGCTTTAEGSQAWCKTCATLFQRLNFLPCLPFSVNLQTLFNLSARLHCLWVPPYWENWRSPTRERHWRVSHRRKRLSFSVEPGLHPAMIWLVSTPLFPQTGF